MAENLTELGLKPWDFKNTQQDGVFWFEKRDGNELRFWSRSKLPILGIVCAIYFSFVWLGPLWMKNRKPYNLERALFIWNSCLAVFSICGAARLLPDLLRDIHQNGFYQTACFLEGNYLLSFWGFAFNLSKVVEFGDTIFIVLRKKPLTFLHWFHHLSIGWFTFMMFSEGDAINRYVGVLNFSVHSIMYTYYAIRALKVQIPKKLSMMVTCIQMLQFIGIISVNIYTIAILANGGNCYRTLNSVLITIFFALSYLILFANMFYKSYVSKPKPKHKLK